MTAEVRRAEVRASSKQHRVRSVRVITTHRTTQEGDGRASSVTLFVLGIAAIVAGSFLYAYRVSRPLDTIASYVPAEATAYVHLRTTQQHTLAYGYTLFDIPAGLTPNEAAAFLLEDADGGGRWTTVLAWNDTASITAAERDIITTTDVAWLNDATLVVRHDDGKMVSTMLAAKASGNSINAGAVANGLRQMRSVAPLQGYVADARLSDDATAPTATVFGTTFDDDGGSLTLLLPLATIPNELPLLGFGLATAARSTTSLSARAAVVSDASVIHRRLSGAAAPPFFVNDDFIAAARDYGVPADTSIDVAFRALLEGLHPPFTFSATIDGTALLHLPSTDPEALADDIDHFLGALFPAKHPLTLPDGTTTNEFRRDTTLPAVMTVNDSSPWPMRVSATHVSGLQLFISPDDNHGSLLASSVEGLSPSMSPTVTSDLSNRCRHLSSFAKEYLLTDSLPIPLKEGGLLYSDPLGRLGLGQVVLLYLDDGVSVVCG